MAISRNHYFFRLMNGIIHSKTTNGIVPSSTVTRTFLLQGKSKPWVKQRALVKEKRFCSLFQATEQAFSEEGINIHVESLESIFNSDEAIFLFQTKMGYVLVAKKNCQMCGATNSTKEKQNKKKQQITVLAYGSAACKMLPLAFLSIVACDKRGSIARKLRH